MIPRAARGKRVVERMFQSWNTIPRVTEVIQVDMSATVAFREAMLGQEQQYGLRISLNDMLYQGRRRGLCGGSHGSMPRWWSRKSVCTTASTWVSP